MINNDNLKKLEEDVVNRLIEVRDDYKATKEELAISIRKDVLLAELKDLLDSESTYYGLKNALEDYIQKLEEDLNGRNKEQ